MGIPKKANAFRVVSVDTVEAYKSGDFSAVLNLDGAYMKKNFESMNKNQYLDDVKYLHFFNNLGDAVAYMQEMQAVVPDVEFCILEFSFNDKMLSELKGKGGYYKPEYRKVVLIDEYVVPVDIYDAAENYIGKVDPISFLNAQETFIEDTYY